MDTLLFPQYKVVEFVLPEEHQALARSTIGRLTGVSIKSIERAKKVGNVFVFNVTPRMMVDPPVIVCAHVDLGWYYQIWKNTHIHKHVTSRTLRDFDLNLQETLKNTPRSIFKPEWYYLRDELEIFRNDYMLSVAVD